MAKTALHWGRLLLIAGAALLGVAIVLVSLNPVMNQPFSPGISYLFLLSAIFLLVSLPGMYARQANAAGWLGLVGYALLQAGTVLFAMLATPTLWYPSITGPYPESVSGFLLGIALTLGLLLTSIATLRAGIFPRWAGILLLAATAGFFFSFFIAEFLPPLAGRVGGAALGVLLSFALAWIGFSMWQVASE